MAGSGCRKYSPEQHLRHPLPVSKQCGPPAISLLFQFEQPLRALQKTLFLLVLLLVAVFF
jgi:hypothetical protein